MTRIHVAFENGDGQGYPEYSGVEDTVIDSLIEVQKTEENMDVRIDILKKIDR